MSAAELNTVELAAGLVLGAAWLLLLLVAISSNSKEKR